MYTTRQPSAAAASVAADLQHAQLVLGTDNENSTRTQSPEPAPASRPKSAKGPAGADLGFPSGELIVKNLPARPSVSPRSSSRTSAAPPEASKNSPSAAAEGAPRVDAREPPAGAAAAAAPAGGRGAASDFSASYFFGQMSTDGGLGQLVRLVRSSSRAKEYLASYARGIGVTSEPPPVPEFFEGFNEFFTAPIPDNEEERIKTLWAYNIIDSGVDDNFMRIVQMAKRSFHVPIALIALVDEKRQWFKAVEGLNCFETDRNVSFCGHAILQKEAEPLVIRDATRDWRFRNNPLVLGDPFIRFYAGAPLRAASGTNLGTLCIIDREPRDFSRDDVIRLKDLAAVVVREIELFAASKHLLFRSRQEESIAAFSRQAIAAELPEEILDLAATSLQEVLEADFLFVAHGRLALPTATGRAPSASRPRVAALRTPHGTLAAYPMRVRTRERALAPAGGEERGTGTGSRAPTPRSSMYTGVSGHPGAGGELDDPEAGMPLGPGTLAAFVAGSAEHSVHVANAELEMRFALPPVVRAAGAKSGAVAAVMAQMAADDPPFAYLGAFSSDPRRYFNDEIRLYLARFAAALEAVLAQWLARQALRVSEQKVRREKQLADRLLKNTLPESVVAKLLTDSNPLADLFEETTIVFADIVGFTALSSKLSATEVVQMLNRIFSRLDHVCGRSGCEKIKTIGDCYMAAAGVPERRPDHAEVALEFAIATIQSIAAFNRRFGTDISVRVGIHSGPVVAGVIGSSKFLYDLWGDTVNVASRMESTGVAGRIQATAATYALLADKYDWTCRGDISVKGKEGALRTYLWNGRLPGDPRGERPGPAEDDANWDAELNIRGRLASVLPDPASVADLRSSSPTLGPAAVAAPDARRPSGGGGLAGSPSRQSSGLAFLPPIRA
eukprot:tig00020904_g15199.t1